MFSPQLLTGGGDCHLTDKLFYDKIWLVITSLVCW